jgi:hypothetical protein
MILLNEQPGATHFNPNTLHVLAGALDDAWLRVDAGAYLNGSADAARTVLAKHIIAMATQGERNRQRLTDGALRRLRL